MADRQTAAASATNAEDEPSASELIDAKIRSDERLARRDARAPVATLIREADPAIVEDIKWRKPSNPGRCPGLVL